MTTTFDALSPSDQDVVEESLSEARAHADVEGWLRRLCEVAAEMDPDVAYRHWLRLAREKDRPGIEAAVAAHALIAPARAFLESR